MACCKRDLLLTVFTTTKTRPIIQASTLTRLYTTGLVTLTLMSFALRLYLLNRFPFREDEAIYSFWALHFWHVDPLFLTVWPDKPPIFLWWLGAAFRLFGTSQASARWLNIVFSTVTIPVTAVTARQLWGRRAALFAAIAFTLNPFAISFAATAYTDPLLVLAGSLAFYLALKQRTFWAGFWLGIAIMTKQQGVLYIPLIIGGLLTQGAFHPTTDRLPHAALRPLFAFCCGLCLIVLPIIYWDSLRWAVAPSPWDLSVRHYGPLALAPAEQWVLRLQTWLSLAWYLTAGWPVWVALTLLLAREIFCCTRNDSPSPYLSISLSPFLLIILWALTFFAIHVITTVQTWDRYLLPLAPPLALFIGRLMAYVSRTLSQRNLTLIALISLLCLLRPAVTAAAGRLPLGGDHGAYTGLTDALTWLTHTAPDHVILYDYRLGWQYRFYLYDQVAVDDYELRWFPNAVYLADNATKAPQRRKFFLEPNWSPMRGLDMHLAMRGLHLKLIGRFGQFTLYEIIQPPQPPCIWCLCHTHSPWLTLDIPAGRGMMSRP